MSAPDMLIETVRIALRSILRNAMRSILTVLGVVIGVAAVIAMVTVGQGSKAQVTADVSKLGTNVLMVLPGQEPMASGPMGTGADLFTLRDVERVERALDSVALAAPIAQTRGRVVFGNENRRTDIVGTDNRYFDAARWEVASGRVFDPGEIRAGRPVCVLGETVRAALFGAADPVGEAVRIGALSCRVVGVLQSKGASTFGSDQDDFVIMPIRTFHRRVAGTTDVAVMYLSLREGASVGRATDEVEALLRELRRIGPGEDDDFAVMDMKQLETMLSGITDVLTGLLSAVAAVSLVVGGIGIMNIMLVSVTERTREIGIRLAIGAQARQVMVQFLVEAIVLSGLGGLIGIGLGLALAFAGARWLAVPFAPDPGIILLAFGVSVLVGVVFGVFPARRAARLDPIEALRHE